MRNKLKITNSIRTYICLFAIIVSSCGNPHQNPKGTTETSTEIISTPIEDNPPVLNVYVENSGSMYGYVGAGNNSEFRNTVYNYLSDIESSITVSELNLNFINSDVIKEGSVIKDFVDKLEPKTFKVSGGNSGATDIAEILVKVYPQDDTISLLVSDCIFSPGRGKNASEYLVNQQIGIKSFLRKQHNFNSTGMIVYRMLGSFKGNYYDTIDNKRDFEGKRPYYLWLMGNVKDLQQIHNATIGKMKSKPDEICMISNGIKDIKYNIVAGGRYKPSHDTSNTVENLKKTKTAQGELYQIKVKADFSNLLQCEEYLLDVSNYETSNSKWKVSRVSKQSDTEYIITIESSVKQRGDITIKLKNIKPRWITELSDENGGFPNPDDTIQKTYGFSYLIGGLFDAYTFDTDNLAELKITIK